MGAGAVFGGEPLDTEPPAAEQEKAPPVSKAALRKYLQENDYRFEELLSASLRRASESVESITADHQLSREEHLALAKSCEEATADLVEIAAETAGACSSSTREAGPAARGARDR